MVGRLFTSRWFQFSFLLVLLLTLCVFNFSHMRWREQIRNFTFDNYNIAKPRAASDAVVIVDIDEASLKKIGQMPWPRSVMADLVRELKSMGAAAIVFDIVFAEADRSSPASMAQIFENAPDAAEIVQKLSSMPDHDQSFGQAITEAGNVVTGFSFTNEPTKDVPPSKGIFRGQNLDQFVTHLVGATVNLKSIDKGAAGNGSFFVSTDTDGIIRRVPMLVGYQLPGTDITSIYPSLSLEAIRVLKGERGGKVLLDNPEYAGLDPRRFGISGIALGQDQTVIPTNARGEFQVYFARSNPSWYLPAWQVLDESVDRNRIDGKIVLVGTSAVGLKDIRSTPLNAFIPGVEVHLNIIDQILQGQFLNRPIEAEGMEAAAVFVMGLFVILFSAFIGALAQIMVLASVLTSGLCAGWYAFAHYGLLVDVTYAAFSVVAVFIFSMMFTYLRTEREKRQVRNAFGLYISPAFMEELTRSPDKLKLGGETRELTVMFTDIRNFTGICEGLSPQEVIQMMNDFLTPMSDMVMANRGTIDKYIGDAMMAFWNAPLDDPDHARHACFTALGMQRALDPVNEKIKARGGKTLLQVGIGINTGPCAVGNMGSKQRFAYSTLGDAVNLASRLEGQTKTYAVPILIGEDTAEKVLDLGVLELDLIRVKGKSKPVRVFALLGDAAFNQSDDFIKLKKCHAEMLAAYRAGDFKKSLALLEECEGINIPEMKSAYAFQRARLQDLIKTPPAYWDGVYEAKTK